MPSTAHIATASAYLHSIVPASATLPFELCTQKETPRCYTMSPAAWLCVFLLVGLVPTPTHGRGLDRRGENDDDSPIEQDVIQYLTNVIVYDINDRNVTGLRTLFTDDVIIMPDGAPTSHGIENVKSVFAEYHQLGRLHNQIEEMRAMDKDDEYIFVRETFQVTDQDGTVLADGKDVMIWKNTEEGYKIYMLIYNLNN